MTAASNTPSTFAELEKSGWQSKAAGYDREISGTTVQAVDPTLDAAKVSEGKHVLDVASGPGIGVAGALKRKATGVGIDFAPAMVELAASNVPEGEFHVGDAEDLPFAEASFDAVTCLFGLLHMPNPTIAISEAFRVLRSGGNYAFTVWDTPDTHEFFALVTRAVDTYGDPEVQLPPSPPMFRFSDHDECTSALADAGFTDIAVRNIELVWRGASGRACLDLITHGSVRAAMLIDYQKPDAREAIRRTIVEGAENFRRGDHIELAWPAVLASGRKP